MTTLVPSSPTSSARSSLSFDSSIDFSVESSPLNDEFYYFDSVVFEVGRSSFDGNTFSLLMAESFR